MKSRINNKDMHVKMVWLKALFYYLTYLVQCLCSLNLLRNRLRPVLPDSVQNLLKTAISNLGFDLQTFQYMGAVKGLLLVPEDSVWFPF